MSHPLLQHSGTLAMSFQHQVEQAGLPSLPALKGDRMPNTVTDICGLNGHGKRKESQHQGGVNTCQGT